MISVVKENSINKATSISQSKHFDIHNASLNDVKKLLDEKHARGEISLKEMLSFTKLDTSSLEKSIGKEVHIQYYDELWSKPNKKRDLVEAYEEILSQQLANKDDQQNILMTQGAIETLKSLESVGQNFETHKQNNKVDMRNISLNEINSPITSGEESLLAVLPFVNPFQKLSTEEL